MASRNRPPKPAVSRRSSTPRPASCRPRSGKLDGLKDLEGHLAAVHQLEKEADGISRAAVARLFRDEMPVIEVIKWRDLYNDLENAIDAAEDAAEAMERMYHKAN